MQTHIKTQQITMESLEVTLVSCIVNPTTLDSHNKAGLGMGWMHASCA